ncbi:MAG: pyrimidine/purine nucleoside phosphorylase [Acidiferrobacterales bacterium]
MNQFENVTIVKKANVYFDGGVTSRTLNFPGGEVKTLGIIQAGEYQFDTGKKEVMEMLSGNVEVLLPGSTEWNGYAAGDVFEIPANSSFRIRTDGLADYCCSFVD